MGWRLLADLVVAVHFGFLAYLLVGGFLAWRWPRTILTHAVAALWALLIVVVDVPCPLTGLQNALRERGGQHRLSDGFIETYVRGTFYPAAYERASQVIVAVLVLVSWVGFALRRRRRTDRVRAT